MEFASNTIDGCLIPCQDAYPAEMIFGQSDRMRGVRRVIEKIAGTTVPVLLIGGKGTGKEVLARYIHSRHPGTGAPFFKVTSPPSNGNVLDEVAFRVEQEKPVEAADSITNRAFPHPLCTLFVDEVADLKPGLQLQLLQLIQGSRSFVMGSVKDIPVNLRIICASSHDLDRESAEGKFRADLLSTLSTIQLYLPPLQERKEDIPALADYFREVYNRKFGCETEELSPHLLSLLQRHDWPGNVRELENTVKRYVVLGSEGIGIREQLHEHPELTIPALPPHRPLSLKELTREATHELEGKIILRTLQTTQWNRKQAARALNISYRALLYKIKEAGLPPKKRRKTATQRNSGKGPAKSRGPEQDAA